MNTKTKCCGEGCRNEALHYDAHNIGSCITHCDYQLAQREHGRERVKRQNRPQK